MAEIITASYSASCWCSWTSSAVASIQQISTHPLHNVSHTLTELDGLMVLFTFSYQLLAYYGQQRKDTQIAKKSSFHL